MKLYDHPQAPSPRLVRIFLAEKGIDVERQTVDLSKGEHHSDWFKAINPFAGVPVLELDDGTHISETIAICRYFEALQPEPPLFGTDAKDQALVEMWRRRIELHFAFPVMFNFRHTHESMAQVETQVPEWGQRCRKLAQKGLGWLERALEGRDFVAGERYSIADAQLLMAIDFARVVDIRPDDEHPNLKRWHEAVSARPSAEA